MIDSGATGTCGYVDLASYRHCTDRIVDPWADFLDQLARRLGEGLIDGPVERVAGGIFRDLFTTVLGWDLPDVNLQTGRADMALSTLGIKRVVIDVKRPGTVTWHRRGVELAPDQARPYAAAQRVLAVALSDGTMLDAAGGVAGEPLTD